MPLMPTWGDIHKSLVQATILASVSSSSQLLSPWLSIGIPGVRPLENIWQVWPPADASGCPLSADLSLEIRA